MSSEIKADKWSPASGTSATIGDSGDTYTIPSGVNFTNNGTATGFGITAANFRPNVNPLIINGNMAVAQRGTSSTSSGLATVDRFKSEFGGVSVTQSQQALSSGSPYDDGLRYFLRATNTSTSSATDAYLQMYQNIEAQNLNSCGWNFTSSSSYVTYSFWVRSSLAGTYYINLRSEDGTSQNFSSPVVLSANTWKKFVLAISGNSNITINNDNGSGLFIGIAPHYGTDYTTSGHTTNAWGTYSGSSITPDYAQSWTNTSSATFDITGVQLEVGEYTSSTIPPFQHESFGDNKNRCCRYYQNSFFLGEVPGTSTSTSNDVITTSWSDGNAPWQGMFQVQMRSSPSIILRPRSSTSTGVISNNGTNRSAVAQQINEKTAAYIAVTSGTAGGYNAYNFELNAEL